MTEIINNPERKTRSGGCSARGVSTFQKAEGCRKIMEARDAFLKTGILAGEIYKESRKQLEKRPWKWQSESHRLVR